MKHTVIVLLALLAVQLAHSSSSEELALRLINIYGSLDDHDEHLKTVEEMAIDNRIDAFLEDAKTEEEKKKIKEGFAEVRRKIRASFTKERVSKIHVTHILKHLNEDEIKALILFYESDAGKGLAKKQIKALSIQPEAYTELIQEQLDILSEFITPLL